MRFLVGLAVGVLLVLAGEYLFLTQGGMPVTAHAAHPLPLERFLTSRALHVAVAGEADRPSPVPADEANLLAGARVYARDCALCHGMPGEPRDSPVAAGMFPRPPRLMPPDKGVTDDPVGETHWKVKNGIRLTGMPGFEGSLTDAELWQVSQLLLNAGALPEPVKAALR
jgi:mono/diheme cytochrome c family protein